MVEVAAVEAEVVAALAAGVVAFGEVAALVGVTAAATGAAVAVATVLADAVVGVAATIADELAGVETETTAAGAEDGAVVAGAGPPQAATSSPSPAMVVARNV